MYSVAIGVSRFFIISTLYNKKYLWFIKYSLKIIDNHAVLTLESKLLHTERCQVKAFTGMYICI